MCSSDLEEREERECEREREREREGGRVWISREITKSKSSEIGRASCRERV